MSKKDVFEWVKKVIRSCRTSAHLDGASNLIVAFDNRYRDYSRTRELQDYFINFVHDNLVFKPQTKNNNHKNK